MAHLTCKRHGNRVAVIKDHRTNKVLIIHTRDHPRDPARHCEGTQVQIGGKEFSGREVLEKTKEIVDATPAD